MVCLANAGASVRCCTPLATPAGVSIAQERGRQHLISTGGGRGKLGRAVQSRTFRSRRCRLSGRPRPGRTSALQHHQQRHQSLAEWQQKHKERQFSLSLPAVELAVPGDCLLEHADDPLRLRHHCLPPMLHPPRRLLLGCMIRVEVTTLGDMPLQPQVASACCDWNGPSNQGAATRVLVRTCMYGDILPSRRRDRHSAAAPPSPSRWCFDRDGERASAK